MKTEWLLGFSEEEPQIFDKLDTDHYIQRRDIAEGISIDGDSEIKGYIFSYRTISKDVYEDIIDKMEDPTQKNIIKRLDDIFINQQINDKQILTIMSAIADLYETIVVLSGINKE